MCVEINVLCVDVTMCLLDAEQNHNNKQLFILLILGTAYLYRLLLLWQDCGSAIEYSALQCVWERRS